jgi:hypothetical protein
MARLIVVAKNQAMTSIQNVTNEVPSEPIPMNGDDRASVIFKVHYLWTQSVNAAAGWHGQVSNDGVNWLNVAGFSDSATSVAATPLLKVGAVNGAWLRFILEFNVAPGVAQETGGTAFDLHVKLDHV